MDTADTVDHEALQKQNEAILLALVQTESFQKPSLDQKIFKDECAYCFKTPLWKDGLFISLKNYHAFCREHVVEHAEKHAETLFVQFQSTKKLVETHDGEPTSKMTKLAVDADPKYEFEDKFAIVIHPKYDHPILKVDAVEELAETIQKIASATSAERLALMATSSNAWDADIKLITKHSNLQQLDNGKRIPSSGWACEAEDCGLTENLWLNLTDGAIRCGRSQFIGEGKLIAGNGHMQSYYDRTKYPLVVKLGTISSNLDSADVYSYDEDDAVVNPNLMVHLMHFGLDPLKMEKTAKSTFEMELDMNEKWEWARCTEDGAILEPIYGPGYTGLINTGSSCYMNSVLQALLQVDSFRTRYGPEGAAQIFSSTDLESVPGDFNVQFAKVFSSMLSGDYSREGETELNAIRPLQFKRIAAGNHHEFATAKQQDVEEYIRFLLEKVTATNPEGVADPTDAVKFQKYTRFEDVASKKVRYTVQEEVILNLPVPEALLQPIPGSENRFSVNMEATVQAFFGSQFVDGYKSPVTGEIKGATNTITMKTFPDYLFVQVQKFAYSMGGDLKKLDLDFEILETLDIGSYRGKGQLDSEESLPEDAPAAVEIPASVRSVANSLQQMGFTENACLRAAFVSNGNTEVATNWLMENLDDPTLNDPFEMPTGTPSAGGQIDANLVNTIVEMGFSGHQARYALKQAPNVADAVEWLFANMDSIPPEEETSQPAPSAAPQSSSQDSKQFRDGNEKYELIGMISHMGSRPCSGHYVAHMLKDGKWVLFNDEKVALSQDPPKKLAYVYLYKRIV